MTTASRRRSWLLAGVSFSPVNVFLLDLSLINRGITLFLISGDVLVLLRKRADEQIRTLQGLIQSAPRVRRFETISVIGTLLEMYLQEHSERNSPTASVPSAPNAFMMAR
jgi:hypothetical protein